ncbi:hypothetical protein EZV61_02085 [Corallincola luteus]|uniref:Uncharacterized protein n=1 Tax=Corallincola luteus TaxID=1775177 RepID=A0ABY2AQZ0_9GAMM|nr:hypothetical protein [Corallincola luteus]TCI04783.1 hypothetical protein EZV61_02085 [Corallincola luteus]
MALCRTIATLASQLELQLEGMHENHRNMIAVMKNMPFYLEKGNLAEWESAYRASIGDAEDESSASYQAIDLVYELAGLNMFGSFQATETQSLYKNIVVQFSNMGLQVSENMDVSQW